MSDVPTATKIAALEEQVRKLQMAHAEVACENARLTNDMGIISNRASMDHEEIDSMAKRNDELRADIEDMRSMYDDRNAYAERLLSENVRLSNEAAFMRSFINNEDVRSDFQTVTQMRQALDRERERCGVLQTALAKINDIRNSIIGFQTVNWSEHIYPLVAALKAAGIDGMAYPEALKNTGTLVEQAKLAIERCGVLEAEVKAWHAAEHLRKDEPHNEFMRLAEARARTRETHALDAAKFVGGG